MFKIINIDPLLQPTYLLSTTQKPIGPMNTITDRGVPTEFLKQRPLHKITVPAMGNTILTSEITIGPLAHGLNSCELGNCQLGTLKERGH
jgi:hypothetical protein